MLSLPVVTGLFAVNMKSGSTGLSESFARNWSVPADWAAHGCRDGALLAVTGLTDQRGNGSPKSFALSGDTINAEGKDLGVGR